MFNQICINEEILPKYINTHTYINKTTNLLVKSLIKFLKRIYHRTSLIDKPENACSFLILFGIHMFFMASVLSRSSVPPFAFIIYPRFGT